jgi:hypothetical protein
MKWCPDCKQNKPESDFTKCSKRSSGLQTYCRACLSMRAAINRLKKPEEYKRRSDKYYASNKDYCINYSKKYIKQRKLTDPNFRDKLREWGKTREKRKQEKRMSIDDKYKEMVFRKNNPDEYVKYRSDYLLNKHRNGRFELADFYIRGLLKSSGVKRITADMVKLKRMSLLGKRKINQINNKINNGKEKK